MRCFGAFLPNSRFRSRNDTQASPRPETNTIAKRYTLDEP
jgi:hypothetical protein